MKNRHGLGLILTGLLMLTAALFFILWNLFGELRAQTAVAQAVAAMETAAVPENTAPPVEAMPEYMQIPNLEMPTRSINGQDYIGTLEIPTLKLTLGIISQWNGERLQIAPCRYTGSVYTDDLVIAAHNYQAHFGKLKYLRPGDSLVFTDVDGNSVSYRVALQEILMPEEVGEMTDGAWDLTLFTCTVGGAYRVTVRCERAE